MSKFHSVKHQIAALQAQAAELESKALLTGWTEQTEHQGNRLYRKAQKLRQQARALEDQLEDHVDNTQYVEIVSGEVNARAGWVERLGDFDLRFFVRASHPRPFRKMVAKLARLNKTDPFFSWYAKGKTEVTNG